MKKFPKSALAAGGLVLACSTLSAPRAYGLIDAQALVGKRWYSFEFDGVAAKGVSATAVELAAHIDPIPLVPIAIGLGVASVSPSSDDLGATATTMLQAGLDVQAWIPLVPFFTPYVRLKLPFMGDLNLSNVNAAGVKTEATYKITGPAVDAGAKFSFLPLVKILVQVGTSMDTIKVSEYKVNGVKQTAPSGGQAPGKSAMVGIEIGF